MYKRQAAALAPLGEKAEEFKDLEALVEDVVSQAEQGDTILVMSNGGFGGVHKNCIALLCLAHDIFHELSLIHI